MLLLLLLLLGAEVDNLCCADIACGDITRGQCDWRSSHAELAPECIHPRRPALQPYGGAGWAAACLLPPSAISLFAHVLVRQESAARGLNWASVWQPVTVEGSFSAATVYNMLALDVLLYALLLAYLDKASCCLPSPGLALPWLTLLRLRCFLAPL